MTADTGSRWPHGMRLLSARILMLTAMVGWFLMVHEFGINLLPYQTRIISPEDMQPVLPAPSHAFAFAFAGGIPDRIGDMRCRLRMWEDGVPYGARTAKLSIMSESGGGCFGYAGDHVIFSTARNEDPRTNGRIYRVGWPLLYSQAMGRFSVLLLIGSLLGLAMVRRPAVSRGPESEPSPPKSVGRVWWGLAGLVFVAGLYCNTGTLAPYAVTYINPYIDPATGHVYNQDHVHFKVLFDFVDGQPRAVWDHALLLRRILYPVICYPAMKLLGFESGGVLMNFLLNLGGFLGAVWWVKRRIGAKGALFAAWLLALYPGMAYWVGMPYQYAVIGPGSILLTILLARLAEPGRWRGVLGWAALMGTVYLAYDFIAIFLPATLLVLLWQRRWRDLLLAGGAQVLPLLFWMLMLRYGFGQTLENSNSSVYRGVIGGLVGVQDWGRWLAERADLWETGLAAFFGSNFIFLPALFLGALGVNRWTSRVPLAVSEWGVFFGGLVLFMLINLGEKTGGWDMSGSWISRLYQPMFPAMVFFLARWWQALPKLRWPGRLLLFTGVGATLAGNSLVLFGPILRDPGGVSGFAFYRFYTHSYADWSNVYPRMLQELPRQTFGFGRDLAKPRT